VYTVPKLKAITMKRSKAALPFFLILTDFASRAILSSHAFVPAQHATTRKTDVAYSYSSIETQRHGWFDLDNLFPQLNDEEAGEDRKRRFPEQYPATYAMGNAQVPSDTTEEAAMLRLLLKQTQLETRPIELAYDASKHGWSAQSFHKQLDGKGGAIVLATTVTKNDNNNYVIGGYNPKGWASMGGSRPSVAAFLYHENAEGRFQKLQKVGGGGMACGRDDPNFGISFGPDSLVIGLQPGREQLASSKLGPYFERGPEERSSLFDSPNAAVRLNSLKVYVGVYDSGEDIPYNGAVMDMTSG
jgi:hypothetical protein